MNALQKPQRVLRKFVSKVSIQTVVKHGGDEAREPLSSLQSREEWPLPRSVDLKDPKVSLQTSQAYILFLSFLYLFDPENDTDESRTGLFGRKISPSSPCSSRRPSPAFLRHCLSPQTVS